MPLFGSRITFAIEFVSMIYTLLDLILYRVTESWKNTNYTYEKLEIFGHANYNSIW